MPVRGVGVGGPDRGVPRVALRLEEGPLSASGAGDATIQSSSGAASGSGEDERRFLPALGGIAKVVIVIV